MALCTEEPIELLPKCHSREKIPGGWKPHLRDDQLFYVTKHCLE